MKTVLLGACVVALLGCSRPKEEPVTAGVTSGPVTAPAPSSATREAVLALLTAHEVEHGNAETWKRLGPSSRVVLLELLADPAHRGDSLHMRAAESLGFVATVDDVQLLKDLAANASAPPTARMGALGGLSAALGNASVPVLAGYLTDPEAGMRSRAVDLLGGLGTVEARAALSAGAAHGDDALKRRVDRALR